MEFLLGIAGLAKLAIWNCILILLLIIAVIIIITLCVELHKMDKLFGGKDDD